jgi:hypothetical protein
METLVLEINNATNYRILLALAEQLEGVSVANVSTKNTAIVAEDSAPYQTVAPKKVRNMEKYIGCLTYPGTDDETVAKLKSIRAEWDRDFF